MALGIPVSKIVQQGKNPLLGKHESWERLRLGDIATIQNGFAFKSARFSRDEGIPLIRIRDVGKDTTETKYIGEYDSAYIIKSGDLLIGMDGDFNCARWHGPRGLLNQRVCRVSLTSDIYHPRLLDYALPGYLKAINEVTSSVTVKHLSSKTISEIPLPLPPKKQQEHIVAEIEKQFSRLDEAIANLKRVKANLKRYRAAVLKSAVEGKLTEDWRKQHTDGESARKLIERILKERREKWVGKGKCKAPQPLDRSNLPKLPLNWCWSSLEEIKLFSLYGPRFSSEDYATTGTIVLRTSDISESGKVRRETAPRLNLTAEEVSKYKLERGDLLITRTGSLGTLAVFDNTVEAIPGAYLIQYRLAAPFEMVQYIFHFFESPGGQKQLIGGGAGVGRLNLNAPTIDAILIPLAPLGEQKRIVDEVERRLSVIEKLETAAQFTLGRADQLRQSILGKAFAGELVSPNSNEEPAAVMIGRMKQKKTVSREQFSDRRGPDMARKKLIAPARRSVLAVLREVNKQISASKLIELSGYPNNADPESIEHFYLDVKAELDARHIRVRREGDYDYFSIRS